MALVADGMPCAICRKPIDSVSPGNVFATTFYGIDHREYRVIDDSAAHRDCVAKWVHRDGFVAYYNSHCCNELRVDRNGYVVYRRSWFQLITSRPVAYVAMPIILPVLGWSRVFGRSRFGTAVAGAIPVIATVVVGLLVTQYFGTIWAVAGVITTWSGFAWSGTRLITSCRT